MGSQEKVILVTGGSGLVGQAIKDVIENERKIRAHEVINEKWIFCGSKDSDLRQVEVDN